MSDVGYLPELNFEAYADEDKREVVIILPSTIYLSAADARRCAAAIVEAADELDKLPPPAQAVPG